MVDKKKYVMQVTDVKGKPYIQVNERIKFFRSEYDGQILTEMISNIAGVCIFKCDIMVDDKVVATGHAYEKEGSSFINKTSHIENCETSAVGRALGIFGIGIDTSIASAEEVGNAIKQQSQPAQPKQHAQRQNKPAIFNTLEAVKKSHPKIYADMLKTFEREPATDGEAQEAMRYINQCINAVNGK